MPLSHPFPPVPLPFPPQASAPDSPNEGDTYYSSTDKRVYVYDGVMWLPMPRRLDLVSGFVASSTSSVRRGYTRSSDPTSALQDFTVMCVFVPGSGENVDTNPKQVFGTRTGANGGGGGWSIQMNYASARGGNARIQYEVTQNASQLRSAGIDIPTMVGKAIVAHLSIRGSAPSIRLYVNGSCVVSAAGGNTGAHTAGGNMCAGIYNDGSDSGGAGQFDGLIHGCGYATTAMTDAEIAAHARAIIEGSLLVQTASGTALADGWRVSEDDADPDGTDWNSFLGGTALTTLNTTALTRSSRAQVPWV